MSNGWEFDVLACTDEAAVLIRSLIDARELPVGTGLRLALNSTTRSLEMSLADTAQPADAIVTRRDISIFVDRVVVDRLSGQILHAQLDKQYRAFYLLEC